MSKEQIKDEINKVLEHLTDDTLLDVLTFLKKVERQESFPIVNRNVLDKILSEDHALLEKLAR
jgi:hypothetical protein